MSLTFKQFVSELAREDVTISSAELNDLIGRFGQKVLQLGHVDADGSMRVPVESVVEAANSLGADAFSEAAETINNKQMISALHSGDLLVEKVVEARERRLRKMIRKFQDQPDRATSNRQWKEIEKEVFGVDFHD